MRMADSLVEVGDGSCVTLVLENCSHSPVRLKKGTRLAETTSVEVVKGSDTRVERAPLSKTRTGMDRQLETSAEKKGQWVIWPIPEGTELRGSSHKWNCRLITWSLIRRNSLHSMTCSL